MQYEPKNFDSLLGTAGFSDTLLKNHFTLYQGYVKNTNTLITSLAKLTEEGKAIPFWGNHEMAFVHGMLGSDRALKFFLSFGGAELIQGLNVDLQKENRELLHEEHWLGRLQLHTLEENWVEDRRAFRILSRDEQITFVFPLLSYRGVPCQKMMPRPCA